MITRLTSPKQLELLPKRGIEAQKIRSLLKAYGIKYDFCRFFCQGGDTFIAALDNNFVLCNGLAADYEELSEFFAANGFNEIFCAQNAALELKRYIKLFVRQVNLMKFRGAAVQSDFDHEPVLDEVYAVLETAFDFEYEPWYLDMSHRIRHGISRCCSLDGSAVLVVQHNLNGEALLSQAAVLPERRGAGLAKRLIGAVCFELMPSDIYVICEDSLIAFYQHCGFELVGSKFVLTEAKS